MNTDNLIVAMKNDVQIKDYDCLPSMDIDSGIEELLNLKNKEKFLNYNYPVRLHCFVNRIDSNRSNQNSLDQIAASKVFLLELQTQRKRLSF